ncbi:MAG: caspase family protein [Bacteroidota bacterium]
MKNKKNRFTKNLFSFFSLFLFLAFNFFPSHTNAQTDRGVKISNTPQNFTTASKLVVIGVSKYQNITSLNYAHTDALAFYNYMTSGNGGKIDPANARLLLNENATSVKIIETLNWLLDVTKEGETVIFYFAGHGDLERKTMFNEGFLLATDAPKVVYMATGTVSVHNLQLYLQTLTQQNKAKVILITDACHSGKLAGGLEGAANTATALQNNWENTIKILSSQPGELSQESEKWNGGGGVFTYYLVKGMMGFADKNNDNKVTINEMNVYLMDKIPGETNFSQNPSIQGNPTTVISLVDPVYFASVKNKESEIKFDKKEIASRGFEDEYKNLLDSATYKEYEKFRYCIDHHYLIKPIEQYSCAVDIYYKLKYDKKAATIINSLKFSLLSALQFETQKILEKYIEGKIPEFTFAQLDMVQEMEAATKLVDSTYILNKQINIRYLLISGIMNINVNFQKGIQFLDSCLVLDPENTIALLFKAYTIYFTKGAKEAIPLAERALSISPKWGFGNNLCAVIYNSLKEYEKSISFSKKCLETDSTSIYGYAEIINSYKCLNDTIKLKFYFKKLDQAAILTKNAIELISIGQDLLRYSPTDTMFLNKTFKYYERAFTLDSVIGGNFATLSYYYMQINQVERAQQCCIRAIPGFIYALKNKIMKSGDAYFNLCWCYAMLNNEEETIKYHDLALNNGYKDFVAFMSLSEFDKLRKRDDVFQKWLIIANENIKNFPNDERNYLSLSGWYSERSNIKEAIKNLDSFLNLTIEKAKSKGKEIKSVQQKTLTLLEQSTSFNNIRQSKEYKKLINKYLDL